MINLVLSYTLYSRLMEGNTYRERSALGVSLDSGPMEGAPCLELLEQSVLSSTLVVRQVEGVTKIESDCKPVINPVQDITRTVDLWRGLLIRSIQLWGCLWTVDSGRGCRA